MKAANWVQDTFRALPRYLLVLTVVSALALLARAAVPSFSRASVVDAGSSVSVSVSVPAPAAAPAPVPAASFVNAASADAALADRLLANTAPANMAATRTPPTATPPTDAALAQTIAAGAAASRLVAQARLPQPLRSGPHSPTPRDFAVDPRFKRTHAVD